MCASRKALGAPVISPAAALGMYRWNFQLPADLQSEPIIDLRMARNWSFGINDWIDLDRMAPPFAVKSTAIPLKVADQITPLQFLGTPASTESGTNSIKSASAAVASGLGIGLPGGLGPCRPARLRSWIAHQLSRSPGLQLPGSPRLRLQPFDPGPWEENMRRGSAASLSE